MRVNRGVTAISYQNYTGEHNGSYWLCVYCGYPADTRDHVPPISRVYDYQSLNLDRELYLLVPACADCNRLLGASLQETFLHRAHECKNLMQKKYRKKISVPDWDEEEVSELDGLLQIEVCLAVRKRNEIMERLDYYTGIDMVLEKINV